MKALLLAGGKGTRLWPLSKTQTPKQIISPFEEEKNLLEMTIERTLNLGFHNEDIFLITVQDQAPLLQPYARQIIIEPEARNTAPAILLGAKKLISLYTDPEESIYVFPTDHYISNFTPNLSLDLHDIILCFRIIPTRAETGYGYIQTHTGGVIRKVRRFTEKPDQQTANQWYESWLNDPEGAQEEKYFWNSGIYAFSLNSLKLALQKIDPQLCDFWLQSDYEEFLANYTKIPKQSFDILIAEQAFNLHSAPLPADSWRDVGTWQSVYEALSSSKLENIHLGKGQLITAESSSCLVKSDQDFNIACAGVDNLAIIISGNQILIADKTNPLAMQELIKKLQNDYPELI
ncbi:MAG: sugar phosphate nucleotidyltransferase [Brevinema sp.]